MSACPTVAEIAEIAEIRISASSLTLSEEATYPGPLRTGHV